MTIPITLVIALLLVAKASSFSSIRRPSPRVVTTISRNMSSDQQVAPPLGSTKGVTFSVPTEDLSLERVRQSIDTCCALTNERLADGYRLRYGKKEDMSTILSLLDSKNSQEEDTLIRDADLFHSIVIEQNDKILGFAITYWAYSTWEGRYLYVNKIVTPNDALKTSLMYTLADVAVRLGGQRLVWQHYKEKSLFYNKELGAETLGGWLTLRMSPEGMDTFLLSRSISTSSQPGEKKMSTAAVDESILDALSLSNGKSEKVKLHLATEDDMDDIERLVDGLAIYDKEVGVIHVNGDHYRVDGFQGDAPMFKCVLIENQEDKQICGMAVFYFGYDIEQGSFLYLEDLFIDEPYRGKGHGTLFMATLACIAKNVGCTGFVWQALDWSSAALHFYDKIGGKILDGRLTTRFNGDVLRSFVDERPSDV